MTAERQVGPVCLIKRIPSQSARVDDGRLVTQALGDAGLTASDACMWTSSDLADIPTEEVVALALRWHARGVDASWASEWCAMGGGDPDEVIDYYLSGYSPLQTGFASLLILLGRAEAAASGTLASNTTEWLNCGLSPAWVCLALAAGCATVEEGRSLYSESLQDPSFIGTLHLICERRGVSARELSINSSYFLGSGSARV